MATIDPVAKSKLDITVQYTYRPRSGSEPTLEDGRLELINNRVERDVKELMIGRRNWLRSIGFEGVQASGITLSICKTAELSELSLVEYLELLSDKTPNLPVLSAETLDQLLPWNKDVQQHFSRS